MDVSIVIVSFNTSRLLDECIESIKKETRCVYEIIVVDNASSDDSCRMLKEKHPEVTLIENSGNAGFARANNQGFAVAQGRYYFMLNSDTVILAGAIDKLLSFMEQNADVGICGPRNVGRDGELQYSCDHFPSLWNVFCSYANLMNRYPTVERFRRSRMQYWDYREIKDVERIAGCSLMVRADVWSRLGGLDGNFFMYFEETDLCYRATKGGQRIVYFPDSTIIHYGGESSKAETAKPIINKTVYSYYLLSQYYFYRKNYGFFPEATIRALDFLYGFTLFMRNAIRADIPKRTAGIAKGKALCSNALRII